MQWLISVMRDGPCTLSGKICIFFLELIWWDLHQHEAQCLCGGISTEAGLSTLMPSHSGLGVWEQINASRQLGGMLGKSILGGNAAALELISCEICWVCELFKVLRVSWQLRRPPGVTVLEAMISSLHWTSSKQKLFFFLCVWGQKLFHFCYVQKGSKPKDWELRYTFSTSGCVWLHSERDHIVFTPWILLLPTAGQKQAFPQVVALFLLLKLQGQLLKMAY